MTLKLHARFTKFCPKDGIITFKGNYLRYEEEDGSLNTRHEYYMHDYIFNSSTRELVKINNFNGEKIYLGNDVKIFVENEKELNEKLEKELKKFI